MLDFKTSQLPASLLARAGCWLAPFAERVLRRLTNVGDLSFGPILIQDWEDNVGSEEDGYDLPGFVQARTGVDLTTLIPLPHIIWTTFIGLSCSVGR